MGKKDRGKRGKERSGTVTVLSVLLIAVAVAGVYVVSLDGEFLWDDEVLVKGNPYIKSFSHLPKTMKRPGWSS